MEVTIKDLLEAGVHFGHRAKRWNPKMKPYIYDSRNGVHIIDLQKTILLLEKASNFVRNLVAHGEIVLFVGTKRQAMGVIEEEAKRAKMPFIVNRWLGGTLTNFVTIQKSMEKLKEIESLLAEGSVEKLHKKDVLRYEKIQKRLLFNLGGIRSMKELPGTLFVVDTKKEKTAIREAIKLKIPVIALIDTNGEPDDVTYPIPGNDDAIKSIAIITKVIADACIEGFEAHKKELITSLKEIEIDEKEEEAEPEVEVIIRKSKKFANKKLQELIIDDEEY